MRFSTSICALVALTVSSVTGAVIEPRGDISILNSGSCLTTQIGIQQDLAKQASEIQNGDVYSLLSSYSGLMSSMASYGQHVSTDIARFGSRKSINSDEKAATDALLPKYAAAYSSIVSQVSSMSEMTSKTGYADVFKTYFSNLGSDMDNFLSTLENTGVDVSAPRKTIQQSTAQATA